MRSLLLGPALLALAACGPTNPGSGSRTLYVVAQLTSDGSTPGTKARITVLAGSATGAAVENATVELKGASSTLAVPWVADKAQYRLEGFAWSEAFGLSVKRGDDALEAALEVPGFSTITAPVAGTTFRRAGGAPLSVRWSDGFGHRASKAVIEFSKAKVGTTVEEGPWEASFPAARLEATDKERISLERSTSVDLAGGIAGSLMSAATTHEVEFRVE